jgi:replicative DNA helicase
MTVDLRRAATTPHGGRVPPSNVDAEAAILGALMLDAQAVMKVASFLQPDDFWVPGNQRIYRAALNLSERLEPIDLLTLSAELKSMKSLEQIGGMEFLAAIESSVPTTANVEYYANLVKDASIKRRLISVGGQVTGLGFDESMSAHQAVDRAESAIFDVAQGSIKRDFVPLSTVLKGVWNEVEQIEAKGGAVGGLSTGFYDLDERTNGLQKGNLIIVAARPGVGKTAFVLNVALNVAKDAHVPTPVGIFSLEMSSNELASRLLCSEAQVDSFRLRKGLLKEHEWPRIAQAMGTLSEARIFIDETPALSIWELKTRARWYTAKSQLGLIIVDYLQLMQGKQTENRVQEISEISRNLKGLARELEIPIIACSQLSREPEKRTDHRPLLSDLRESGSLEQDADIVLFIYRERLYDNNLPPDKRDMAEIIIAKNRNGPMAKVDLRFVDAQTKFENLEFRRSLPTPKAVRALPEKAIPRAVPPLPEKSG